MFISNRLHIIVMLLGKHGMVKFYQSWCGHCMRMKPDWDRLAEEENNDSVLIADVNCGDQKEVSFSSYVVWNRLLYEIICMFIVISWNHLD